MPFIGPKPADTVLDSTLIADGTITSAKIADGAIVNADLNNSAAIATSKITGLATSATTDTTNAANIASGTIADARIPNLATSKITSGTMATARLGSGTASSSTFLRGDSTFAEAGGGKVLQLVSSTETQVRSTTSSSYTKASNGLDIAITPSASSSKVLIMCSSGGGVTAAGVRGWFSFFRDSTDLGSGDGVRTFEHAGDVQSSEIPYVIYFLDTPNTTSQVTYSIQMKVQGGGTLYFGQKGGSTMTCMEIGV